MSTSRLDELALAGPEHRDPAYVAGYDRKARLDPSVDLALLRERGLAENSTLVDLGAGTGTFALAAASVCRRVVAVDVSPAMVAAMQKKAAASGIANVECVQAGFLSYQHTGAPADFIYTRNALHHLPDFWKAMALHRMAELLRPGGVLHLEDIVFAFEPHEAEERIAAWLATGAERAEDGWTRDELETHVRDEYSTFIWLLEPMLQRAGFEIRDSEHGRLGMYAYYLCSKTDLLSFTREHPTGLSSFQQSATCHLAKEPRFVPVELAETLVHAPDNVLAGWRPEQLERPAKPPK